jgi:drug/metabolite transporter (DMT)-like permease
MTRTRSAMVLMVLFATSWAVVELIGALEFTRVSALQIVWTRYAAHLAFMLLLFGWRSPLALVRTRRLPLQLGRSMLMVAMPVAWMLGQHFGIPYAEFMPVFWVTPLLVMAFAALLLGERAPLLYWLAAVLACLGAALQFNPVAPGRLWHLVFPLLMAGSFSLYVVLARALRGEPTQVNLFYTALGVFVVLSPLMPFVWIAPAFGDLAILVTVGLVGYVCLYLLDRVTDAVAISITAPLLAVQALAETAVSTLFTRHLGGTAVELGVLAVAASACFLWFARHDAARYNTKDSSRAEGSGAVELAGEPEGSPWRRLFR